MANAFSGPDMVATGPSGMDGGNAFSGNGQPNSSGNLFKLREIWQRQYIDGETTKQFTEWMAEQNHRLYQR